MNKEKFIKKHSSDWKKLESITDKVDKKGIKTLSSHRIKTFLKLFQKSSRDLAYARTHYPESNTVKYLNDLISRSHNHIYAVKKVSHKEFADYIFHSFPLLLRKYKCYIISSTAFFALGVIISFFLIAYNPENASYFLEPEMIETIQSNQMGAGDWNYAFMSSYIMINNIQVALRAFVFGITLGLGTLYVLYVNGAMLGALTALVYLYADPVKYWSLILPHGIIELTAIFIAGAAGLIIAKNILVPGEYSRKNALISGAKNSVSLIAGTAVLLIAAGIIEGFFTPLALSSTYKLIFAAGTGILLILYFSLPYTRDSQD